MYRPLLPPIALEVAVRTKEIQCLASIANKKLEQPVIFVFDTKSKWADHAKVFSEITGYPEETFRPNQHERFSVGYCTWWLCEYAAMNFPPAAEDILEPSEIGRVKIINFFEVEDKAALSAGNIVMIDGYMT